jgi:glycosyltransferase involved in cell wall biosynthesis
MLNGKRIVVVMPAYNAARTLRRTYDAIPRDVVDGILLVDDASSDETVAIARELGIRHLVHETNRGYGANQKTCYRHALAMGADVVVMLHADYQYDPRLIPAMAAMITSGVYDVVLGSRLLGKGALAGGMPVYKFVSNRLLTLTQNLCFRRRLTEYHTGYRAFSRRVLLTLPLEEISDRFIFDNEILVQLVAFGYEIAEITCPAKYFEEASSTGFWRSTNYGIGVLRTTLWYLLARTGLYRHPMFDPAGRRLRFELPDGGQPRRSPETSPR